MQGPEGRPPNVSPARKGWEIDPEEHQSAVGAAQNRSSALPVSLGAIPACRAAVPHISRKTREMWESIGGETCAKVYSQPIRRHDGSRLGEILFAQ